MHYIIGIDTGVNTGFAIWSKQEKKFEAIGTMLIHQAMKEVEREIKLEALDALSRGKTMQVKKEDITHI